MKFIYLIFSTALIFLGDSSISAQPNELFNNSLDQTKYQDVLVQRVLSADTILLDNGDKFKLIGLKAPETPRRARIEYDRDGKALEREVLPENTLEEKAFAFAVHLLEGKQVHLEFDVQGKDEDFTAVVYVFLVKDNLFANAEILRHGYADLKIRPPNLKYADRLREAYREAHEEKRGIQGQ